MTTWSSACTAQTRASTAAAAVQATSHAAPGRAARTLTTPSACAPRHSAWTRGARGRGGASSACRTGAGHSPTSGGTGFVTEGQMLSRTYGGFPWTELTVEAVEVVVRVR